MPDGGGWRVEEELPGRWTAEELAAQREREPEELAEEAFQSAPGELPPSGLLSFYDRLRERIVHAVEHRGGRFGEGVVRFLLLVPDVFVLLLRLTLDGDVPGPVRTLIGGALAYFVVPIDFVPEALVGPAGFLDDLVLASAVLSQAFGGELEPYARRHWSGQEDLRVVLEDVALSAEFLLGEKIFGRLAAFLGRHGIELPKPKP
ncbi:MAG: DUF1232 domain-containing protein [Thermoanaerobaculia bacterium]|nr:DUF1232 domain-containing protein [Thermoanaerobaculia bacterium]